MLFNTKTAEMLSMLLEYLSGSVCKPTYLALSMLLIESISSESVPGQIEFRPVDNAEVANKIMHEIYALIAEMKTKAVFRDYPVEKVTEYLVNKISTKMHWIDSTRNQRYENSLVDQPDSRVACRYSEMWKAFEKAAYLNNNMVKARLSEIDKLKIAQRDKNKSDMWFYKQLLTTSKCLSVAQISIFREHFPQIAARIKLESCLSIETQNKIENVTREYEQNNQHVIWLHRKIYALMSVDERSTYQSCYPTIVRWLEVCGNSSLQLINAQWQAIDAIFKENNIDLSRCDFRAVANIMFEDDRMDWSSTQLNVFNQMLNKVFPISQEERAIQVLSRISSADSYSSDAVGASTVLELDARADKRQRLASSKPLLASSSAYVAQALPAVASAVTENVSSSDLAVDRREAAVKAKLHSLFEEIKLKKISIHAELRRVQKEYNDACDKYKMLGKFDPINDEFLEKLGVERAVVADKREFGKDELVHEILKSKNYLSRLECCYAYVRERMMCMINRVSTESVQTSTSVQAALLPNSHHS